MIRLQIQLNEQQLLKNGCAAGRALQIAIEQFQYEQITQEFEKLHEEILHVKKQITAMHGEQLLE